MGRSCSTCPAAAATAARPCAFQVGEFKLGGVDEKVGEIVGCEFWMDREQFRRWAHTQWVVDVVAGRGASFSLEAPLGKRFLIRSSLCMTSELATPGASDGSARPPTPGPGRSRRFRRRPSRTSASAGTIAARAAGRRTSSSTAMTFAPAAVLVRQPVIRGALVVGAVQLPVLLDLQIPLEPQQRVGRGHQPAGEEVPPHPVVVAGGRRTDTSRCGGRRCGRTACPAAAASTRSARAACRSCACARTSRSRHSDRSAAAGSSRRFMSGVTTRTLSRPRSAAARSMCSRCKLRIGDRADARAADSAAAIHRVSDPQPQPSSRMSWPSASSARWPYSSSIASSACASDSCPVG